jgi:formimidoylglutamate deiminase
MASITVASRPPRNSVHTPRAAYAQISLPGRALIPGFVNGHSHAFQRLARGRNQTRPMGRDAADFWSWREAMYGIALALSADDVYHISRFCFLEMIRTGITAVGEFHYLHHQPDGTPYDEPNELALRVVAAARDVGMRIRLLNVCYATGGIGEPLGDRQRRFGAGTLNEFLERTDRLDATIRSTPGSGADAGGGALALVGVAPHSVRAVPREWLRPLREWAAARDMPVHMHVSERPAEVQASIEAYGIRPVELLHEDGLLDDRFTAVHATHLSDGEVELLGGSGAVVCACPTTERDLGDGFLRALDLTRAGAPIALGTDSHTSLDFLEEMRLVEYHERLQRLERVAITDGGRTDDTRHRVAPVLLEMATEAGARSLRLDAGRIEPGRLADLVALDLGHHSLAGWTDDTLAATVTLSATPDIVHDVWVHGVRRLDARRHEADEEAMDRFRTVASPPN